MVVKRKIPSKVASKIPGNPAHPLYGMPIREITAKGNLAEMKKWATFARKHVKEVQAALNKLDAKIQRVSGK